MSSRTTKATPDRAEAEARMLVVGATLGKDSEDAKRILREASALLLASKPLPAAFQSYLGEVLSAVAANPRKAAQALNLSHASRPRTSLMDSAILAATVARHERAGLTSRAAIHTAARELGLEPSAAEKRMQTRQGMVARDFLTQFEDTMRSIEKRQRKSNALAAELSRVTSGGDPTPESTRLMDLMLTLLAAPESVRKKD